MGVIYKLKTKIKDYIIEEKNNKPILSCRNLVSLIESRFQIKVSKSSINAVIKESGLSMPVGRRRKKRRRKAQISITLPLQIENKQVEHPLLEAQKRELIEQLPEPVIERPIEEPKAGIPVEKIAQVPLEPVPEIPTVAPIEEEPEKPSEALPEALPEKPPQEPMVKPQEAPIEKPAEALEELPSEIESTGAILLKIADYLIGGSSQINEAIKERLNRGEKGLLAKTESLIYMSLFNLADEKELSKLWAIVNKKIPSEDIMRYLNDLQAVSELSPIISGVIWKLFQEVRSLKVILTDGSHFYIDGQLYTVWSTPQIPYSFSTTIYNIKSYVNGCFEKYKPFVLFSAPGYDMPTKELFDFMLSLEGKEKGISKLIIYSHKLEEIQTIYPASHKNYFFIFGLWPWQFGQYRRVKLMGETRQFSFEPLKKDFYLTEAEVELTQPVINKRVTLKGCALKTNPDDKIRLIILTNLPRAEEIEELAHIYLSHWPNLEEGFQDFSRKIELFTYTALSRQAFSIPQPSWAQETADIKQALADYLNALDAYVRWHFLPPEYKERDFSTVNERFYQLKAQLKKKKDTCLVRFILPPGYAFLKDLSYCLSRMNEQEIILADKKRLWLSL